MCERFKNEPIVDFSNPENRKKMEDALQEVKSLYGKKYPLVIGGKEVWTKEKFESLNPSRPSEVVGVFCKATEKEAELALKEAWRAFAKWQFELPEKRAALLFKSAELVRKKRFLFDAVLVLEVGKSWVEADADVAEALDFLEYYAREALRLCASATVPQIPSEKSEMSYIPLGAGVVIPPWNFPCAILVGMTSSSIVVGNTVVLKPASDSPFIGWLFFEVLREAGLPDGVVNFLTGAGSIAGEFLVKHPKTRFVTFTGSKDVGARIYELASRVQQGQIWLKRVIAEMGGKDAIIVDSEAELDKAAAGVLASAFGFQGQKCSACSRLILLDDIYDKFMAKFLPMVKKIVIGCPDEGPHVFLGPVINKVAEEKILRYIDIGKSEGELICGGSKVCKLEGHFIKPTVFDGVSPNARIAQEEIFGPVVAVIRAKNFDRAISIANNTIYGLTGSVYTTNREKIERAKKMFHVGNLYFNRKCTGALVGVHPFGGFNMSGTDSKAGGPDYLLLLTQAKSVSEIIA